MVQNEALLKDSNRLEVKCALKEISSTKVPESNGMQVMFYQRYWDIVSDEVVHVCLNILYGHGDLF